MGDLRRKSHDHNLTKILTEKRKEKDATGDLPRLSRPSVLHHGKAERKGENRNGSNGNRKSRSYALPPSPFGEGKDSIAIRRYQDRRDRKNG